MELPYNSLHFYVASIKGRYGNRVRKITCVCVCVCLRTLLYSNSDRKIHVILFFGFHDKFMAHSCTFLNFEEKRGNGIKHFLA